MFLTDGYQTLFSMSLAPGVFLREREVTPPSLEGGGGIDTTTMLNSTLRTMAPKSLITMGEMTAVCQYDPKCYTQLIGVINKPQVFTVTFPDSSFITFRGWLDSFKPNTHKEGDFPTAEVKIIPSNRSTANVGPSGAPDVAPSFIDGLFPGLLVT